MATLRIVGLQKKFDDAVAVDALDFEVDSGEFVALLGPSGCGKTTTLRMIAGLETPTIGQILVADERVENKPAHRRDTILVFQNYALFPHKTVYQNISFGLRHRGVPKSEHRERVHKVLETVRLPGVEQRRPGQLSGGQQQRIALARALAVEPSVLLLDEPLSNLDRKLRDEMRLEIKRIQRQFGITTILVTHDQEEAMSMADRIVMMNAGRIEQVGPPADVYARPRTPFVADFLGKSAILKGTVHSTSDGLCEISTSEGLELRASDTAYTVGDAVAIQLRSEHVRIAFHTRSRDLANAYEGRVTDITYLGQHLEIRVDVDGIELIAVNTGPLDVARDDLVPVSIDYDKVHVMPAISAE